MIENGRHDTKKFGYWPPSGCKSTLVTYPQLGHSYAINPGSPARGAMLTTSSIAAPHLVHARARRRLLLDKSDTIPAPYVRALLRLRLSMVANAPCAGWLRSDGN
jgi:hypothetical protein